MWWQMFEYVVANVGVYDGKCRVVIANVRVSVMTFFREYYRRNGLRSVRLLQDDETLRYIFEQFSRFATFFPEEMKEECSIDIFRTILMYTMKFGGSTSGKELSCLSACLEQSNTLVLLCDGYF
eukprot:954373_1